MSEAGVVRRRRSQAEAEALVAEFEASGLMRGAFVSSAAWQLELWINIAGGCKRENNRVAGRYFLSKSFGPPAKSRTGMRGAMVFWWLSWEVGVGSKCGEDSMWERWSG